MQEMLDRNKRAMNSILNTVIPEKKQHFTDYIDDDGMGMGSVQGRLYHVARGGHSNF
jgi:hypothetical protein